MKHLKYSTNRNPKLNTIKDGLSMQNNFRHSKRWESIDQGHGGYPSNDHDFHHSGFSIWRDVNNNTLVKECYSTNRKGDINNIEFYVIEEWPESDRKTL
jgi:hypothetical protein